MSLTKQFATDVEKEVAGVEVTYGANEDGTVPTFVISRAGKSNKQYQKALATAIKPYERQQQLGTLEPEVAERVYMGVFIATLLKGWSNVKLSDVTGEASDKGYADFSAANARKLFDRLPELYDDLTNKAGTAAMFREEMNDSKSE